MAQIPGSQGLGEAVARPADLSNVRSGADAFGAGLFRAVEGAGADVQRQEVQAQREADAMRREADALAREEARQAQLERRAADKAQALGVMQSTADALQLDADELSAGVLSGQVDKTQADAEWSTKARERVSAALEGVPADHRAAVERDLAHRVHTLGRGSVTKAVRQRDRDDAKAGVLQTLEYSQRLYASNPAAAVQLMTQTVDSIGPAAGWGADDIAKEKQKWHENTQFTTALEAVSAGRNDRKALDRAEALISKLPALDPQKRVELQTKAATFRMHLDQQAENAARAAERRAEAAMRISEAAWKAGNDLALMGVLNPDYAERLQRQMIGPHAAAFKEMLKQQAISGPIAARSNGEIRAEVDRLSGVLATSATPEAKQQRDLLERIADGQENAIKKDGLLRAATTYGVIQGEKKPLDFSKGLAGVGEQLQGRFDAASAAALWARDKSGRVPPVEILYPEEADRMKQLLDALPAKDRAGSVLMLGKALGPQASAGLAAQIERQTKGAGLPERAFGYALAMQDGMTTAGRLRSELVLKGAEAMRSGASTKVENPRFGAPPSRWGGILAGRLEGFPSEAMRTQIVEAATLIAHGLAAESGGEMQVADLDKALRLAIGGELVPRGVEVVRDGKKQPALVPLPAGRTEADLDKAMRAVTPDMLGGKPLLAGGKEIPADVFVRDVLPSASVAPMRPGVYSIMVNGRAVLKPDGQPASFQVK